MLVQAEVAERLAAPPGSAAYGVPSVKAAWYGEVRRAGNVGRRVFWPEPNVDSGLVVAGPPSATRRATGGRPSPPSTPRSPPGARGCGPRSPGGRAARPPPRRGCAPPGIDPTTRGEQLSVTDFARLAATDPVQP